MYEIGIVGNVAKVFEGIAKASDKAAVTCANQTAFAARRVMSKTSRAQGEPLKSVRITMATPSRMYAVIRDRGWAIRSMTGWAFPAGAYKVRAPLAVRGGAQQVLVPASQQLAGGRKLKVALDKGFTAIMQSGKVGQWKRDGKSRTPISLLYSLRTEEEVKQVIAAGVEAARVEGVHSFTKAFARIGKQK